MKKQSKDNKKSKRARSLPGEDVPFVSPASDVSKKLEQTPLHAEPDDDGVEDDGLTLRQRLFVQAITGPKLGNATQAAILAGYRESSARQIATENLSKPSVQRAISHALAKKCLSPEWAIQEIHTIANTDFSRFVTVQEDGRMRVDWLKAAASGALGAIKELSFDKDTGEPKIKTHDRVKALQLILQTHGLLKEKLEVTAPEGVMVKVVKGVSMDDL
jgi:phage terminase small subunit